MKRFIVLFILIVPVIIYGQEFRQRTSEFILDTSLSPDEINADIPNITWVTPEQVNATSEEPKVKIKLDVTSVSNLENVKIVIRDTRRGAELSEKEIVMDDIDDREEQIEYDIYLPEGYSTIEVYAYNEQGGVATSSRNMIIGTKAMTESVALMRKDYALLIATDEYDHWGNLVNPINDAETIRKELENNYGFDTELIRNATINDMMVKIREYAEKDYGEYDQLFIFIAGHGQFDESFGMGYVVGKNSLREDPAKTTYLSHSNLRDVVNNIPCEHIFLAMDVCFGGTFDQAIAASSRGTESVYQEVSTQQYVLRKLEYKTRRYMTSGGKEYVSDGIPGKHSPFARKLLDALRNYGGPDRVLTLPELNVYVEKLNPQPRSGEFGDNAPGSDFVFVAQ